MKRIALLMLAFLLCTVQGMAEGESRTGEGALSVNLERLEASDGMASMTLRFISRASQPLRVWLIEPSFNDASAMFSNGWNTDEVTVEANGSRTIDISILSLREAELPEEVSLRFAANGAISSQMSVRCEGEGFAVTDAAFDLEMPEPLIVSDQPISGEVLESERRILRDRLNADETARLNFGRAVICLHETGEGEDRLVRFCTLPATVNDNGFVQADYSGYAVTVSVAPSFPLSTVEEVRDVLRLFHVSRIVLTGETVFYADLAFELRRTEDGSLTLGEYSIKSEELGGIYHNAPLSLFSGFSSSNAVLSLDGCNDGTDARVVDDHFISIPLEQSLVIEVKPASELGEIYAYFEYFFRDNRSIILQPFPL